MAKRRTKRKEVPQDVTEPTPTEVAGADASEQAQADATSEEAKAVSQTDEGPSQDAAASTEDAVDAASTVDTTKVPDATTTPDVEDAQDAAEPRDAEAATDEGVSAEPQGTVGAVKAEKAEETPVGFEESVEQSRKIRPQRRISTESFAQEESTEGYAQPPQPASSPATPRLLKGSALGPQRWRCRNLKHPHSKGSAVVNVGHGGAYLIEFGRDGIARIPEAVADHLRAHGGSVRVLT